MESPCFCLNRSDPDFLVVGTTSDSGSESGPVRSSNSTILCEEGAQSSSIDLHINTGMACIGVDFKLLKGVFRVPSGANPL